MVLCSGCCKWGGFSAASSEHVCKEPLTDETCSADTSRAQTPTTHTHTISARPTKRAFILSLIPLTSSFQHQQWDYTAESPRGLRVYILCSFHNSELIFRDIIENIYQNLQAFADLREKKMSSWDSALIHCPKTPGSTSSFLVSGSEQKKSQSSNHI